MDLDDAVFVFKQFNFDGSLNHCGLGTPYGDTALSHNWLT